MDHIDRMLDRPTKGSFYHQQQPAKGVGHSSFLLYFISFPFQLTLFFCLQSYALVDPQFYKHFKHQLTDLWQLVDSEKNVHAIVFENDRYEKKLMLGRNDLSSFYKITANHSMCFCYLGEEDENSILKSQPSKKSK